jgi:hypothetical protein
MFATGTQVLHHLGDPPPSERVSMMHQDAFNFVTLIRREDAPPGVLENMGEIVVAIKFEEPQPPILEVSPAEAMKMAAKIRTMIARRFGATLEPGTSELSCVTVSASRGVVQIHLDVESRKLAYLAMLPQTWLWLADKLEDSSSLSRLPGAC